MDRHIIRTALPPALMALRLSGAVNGDIVPTWTGTMMTSVASKSCVTPERHIWACANTLMQQHGSDAWFHASGRADELLVAGDFDGYAMFKAILTRIVQLEKMTADGAIH